MCKTYCNKYLENDRTLILASNSSVVFSRVGIKIGIGTGIGTTKGTGVGELYIIIGVGTYTGMGTGIIALLPSLVLLILLLLSSSGKKTEISN